MNSQVQRTKYSLRINRSINFSKTFCKILLKAQQPRRKRHSRVLVFINVVATASNISVVISAVFAGTSVISDSNELVRFTHHVGGKTLEECRA